MGAVGAERRQENACTNRGCRQKSGIRVDVETGGGEGMKRARVQWKVRGKESWCSRFSSRGRGKYIRRLVTDAGAAI